MTPSKLSLSLAVCASLMSSAIAHAAPPVAFVQSDVVTPNVPRAYDYFGGTIVLDGDRLVTTAVVGGGMFVGPGDVYVHERDATGAWVQVAKIEPPEPDDREFGKGLSLDGDRLFVSATKADIITDPDQYNSVYVYERDAAGAWSRVQTIRAPEMGRGDFGHAVDVEGDRAVIGARYASGDALFSGAAYLYERNAQGRWVLVQELSAGDSERNDGFGWAVGLHGDLVVVGAPSTDYFGIAEGSGSAFVFERDFNGDWQRVQRLFSSGVKAGGNFGTAVRTTDDHVVIGESGGAAAGAVRVYELDASGDLTVTATLQASSPTPGDAFGLYLDVHGDRVVSSTLPGADRVAFVFELDASGGWSLIDEIQSPDPSFTSFGRSLAVSNRRVAIGSARNSAVLTNAGAVYLYDERSVANDDVFTTSEDTPLTLDLLANDRLVSGATLGAITGFDAGGSVVLDGSSVVTYTPAADYNGDETFEYTLVDAYGSYPASVTVSVASVNDAPVALDAAATTAAGMAIPITLEATDVEGDDLTYTATQPSNGTLSGLAPVLAYTPNDGFSGEDAFTFTVNDGQADSAPATVTITVTGGPNDAPVFVDPTPADGAMLEAEVGVVFAFTLAADDTESGPDPVSYSIVGAPASSSLDSATGDFTWTPAEADLDEQGKTWTLRATDGIDTVSRQITVVVSPEPTSGEDAGGEVDAGGEADAGDGDPTGDDGSDDSDDSGCATAPARPGHPSLAWVALLGLVGLARSRRS